MSDVPDSAAAEREFELFTAAGELVPAERAAFLARACETPELRARIEALLARDAAETGLDRSALERLIRRPTAPPLPERIGPFRVLRLLGEGGMGRVYECEQEDLRRTVALKIVRPGLMSEALVRRFEHEARVLGRLNHPGIAQIHETGVADTGAGPQPFFAMELVRGLPLLRHAEEHQLELEARVELLARVCEAVQHAHQKGVIHRDLKPANILVEATGQPKILDFGVARATDADLQASSFLTSAGTLVGTLVFMSPEQVSGRSDDLDTRSDVWALGVIAYELWTGRAPFDLRARSLPEAVRTIVEEDPPSAGSLAPRLRGDLEIIVHKALEKDRERRYASAEELGRDLRRYLAHEPIAARAPTALYQLARFARRHRALSAGAAVGVAALVLGAAGASWFAWHQARLRAAAEREAYRANLIAAGAALEQENPVHARALLAAAAELDHGWEQDRLRRELDPWVASFELPGPSLWQAAFVGDGERAVAVERSGATWLWDTTTGRRELELPSAAARADPAAITGDGEHVLSVGAHEVRVWATASGEVIAAAEAPEPLSSDPRGRSVLAPDGRRAVVCAEDGTRLWLDLTAPADAERWKALAEEGFFAFSGNGRWLVQSGSRTELYSGLDGSRQRSFEVEFSTDAPALDHEGRRLAFLGPEGELALLDVASGALRLLGEVPRPPSAGQFTLQFAPDGRHLAVLQDEGTVTVWELAHGRQVERFLLGRASWKTSLSWHADSVHLLTAAFTHPTVRIASIREGPSREILRGHESFVYPVAYSPDGRHIASGSWDRTLRLWSAETGDPLATFEVPLGRVHCLAWTSGGERVVGGTERELVAWSVRTGQVVARATGSSLWYCVASSPDGRTLMAANEGEPGRIRRLDAETLELRGELALPRATDWGFRSLAHDPTGTWLLAGNARGELTLWDLARGALRQERDLEPEDALGPESVNALAFAPDGRRVVVATDGRLTVLAVPSLEPVFELVGHAREVFGVACAPDGSRFFSGGRDGRLRVWDAARGELLSEFSGHEDYLWGIALHPDGARIVTSSGDGTVRQWESEPARKTEQRRLAALRSSAAIRPQVAARLVELGDPMAVAQWLEREPGISAAERQAGFDEVLKLDAGPR